jgi:hypothetical protein
MDYASPGYFELMGMPVVLGRDFLPAEREGFSAIVISRENSQRLWGEANPIGRRLVHYSVDPSSPPHEIVVVGVVDESEGAYRSMENEHDLLMYAPIYAHSNTIPMLAGEGGGNSDISAYDVMRYLYIRTEGRAEAQIPSIRAIATDEASGLPIAAIRTLSDVRRGDLLQSFLVLGGAAGAGMLGLILSAVGLYGVLAIAVRQRVREIGIRMAVGSTARGIRRHFVAEGLRVCLWGLGAGMILSFLVYQVSRLRRWDVGLPTLVPAIAFTAVTVLVTALLASWLPARRAAAVDPMTVLRVE